MFPCITLYVQENMKSDSGQDDLPSRYRGIHKMHYSYPILFPPK